MVHNWQTNYLIWYLLGEFFTFWSRSYYFWGAMGSVSILVRFHRNTSTLNHPIHTILYPDPLNLVHDLFLKITQKHIKLPIPTMTDNVTKTQKCNPLIFAIQGINTEVTRFWQYLGVIICLGVPVILALDTILARGLYTCIYCAC